MFDCGPQSPARVALIESKPCTANAQLSLASAAAAAAAYRTSPLTHVVVVVDVDIKLFFSTDYDSLSLSLHTPSFSSLTRRHDITHKWKEMVEKTIVAEYLKNTIFLPC